MPENFIQLVCFSDRDSQRIAKDDISGLRSRPVGLLCHTVCVAPPAYRAQLKLYAQLEDFRSDTGQNWFLAKVIANTKKDSPASRRE